LIIDHHSLHEICAKQLSFQPCMKQQIMSSLCSFLDADGIIDVEGAFQFLRTQYPDEEAFEECSSLLDCLTEDDEIDVDKFNTLQNDMPLMEMLILI
jgi:hypothetical protein